MSIAGILSSTLFNYSTQNIQNKVQDFRQEFQQLGQDLQSGNLSAARADFATLEQSAPQANSTSSSAGSNPITQEFNQLAHDLQSGNLPAAQQDYANIQQNFQNQAEQGRHHHHHGGAAGGGSEASAINQILAQLGQDLQSGNLSAAQQAYSTLQQDFQQLQTNNPLAQSSSQAGWTTTSVNA
jgi:hypothetical protein